MKCHRGTAGGIKGAAERSRDGAEGFTGTEADGVESALDGLHTDRTLNTLQASMAEHNTSFNPSPPVCPTTKVIQKVAACVRPTSLQDSTGVNMQ